MMTEYQYAFVFVMQLYQPIGGDAGLGYRIACIVFGMHFAQETETTFTSIMDYDTI